MAKARKMPSGKWRIQPVAKGQRICITADSKREAEAKALAWQARQEHYTPTRVELKDAVRGYIDASAAALSPATIRGYEIALKRIKGFDLSWKRLDIIRQADLQKFVADLAGKYAPKTVRNTLALVTASMRFYGVSAPHGINLPREGVKAYKTPSDADVRRLLDACEGTDFEVAVMLAAFAGLRRSEIVALTSEDLDGDVLHVRAAIVKGSDHAYHTKGTKTRSSDRYIRIPDFVADRLKGIAGPLYPYPAEGITKRFETLRKRAGVDCRFHDLRAYHASKMHSIGIPDQYVIGRLGWSTDYTLKRIYRREIDDVTKAMNDKTNKAFSDVFSGGSATISQP